MRKYFIAASIFLVFLAVRAQTCGAVVDIGIATGNEKGTYYRFGQDLGRLMEQHGFSLTVYPSAGSVDNIYTVYKVPFIQLGMVQSDVLAFVAEDGSDKILKTLAQKIRVLFPLYTEEVQIVARKEIGNFSGLSGRRVAVGEEGSGTYLTAKLLFKASGIKPGVMLDIGTEQALARLKEGKIDAMFYVAGAPVKLFSESVSTSDNLRLVPVVDPKILQYYPAAEIPANTYGWQDRPVSTVAVKAVLVAYSENGGCADVCGFAEVLFENLDQLVSRGHPKWKTVDLRYAIKGWTRYQCVKRLLGLPAPENKPLRPNPVFDAIQKALN